MKKEIYIHVGAGKTGTTALQQFFFLNEQKLGRKGLYFPSVGRAPSNSAIAHHALACRQQVAKGEETEEIKELWKNLASENEGRLLVTSEDFHALISDQNGIQFLKEIKSILSDQEVFIIFYIRREDEWLQSAYSQWIKSGSLRNGVSIHEFIKKKRVSLPEQILKFSDIFGKDQMIVKPFEKIQLIGGNVFSDFMDIFDIQLNDGFNLPNKNTNQGLTNDALEFKRVFNTVCIDKNEAQILMKPLIEYSKLVDKNSSEAFTKKNLLSQDERKYLLEPLVPLYASIAREFLGRDDGMLFCDLDEQFESLGTDQLGETRIVAFLLKELYRENAKLRKEIRALKGDVSGITKYLRSFPSDSKSKTP